MKIFFLLLLFALPAAARAENPAPEKLAQEMGDRITRVPEFSFIREEAEKLGVRVYLFGGTAAAYGHYIRQDLAREAGDKRYPDFLYDYDYTNVFRSTQDLDIVVDGPASKAQELEGLLKQKFPHFVGGKAAQWEVRPLREARGDKEAILGNPDFLNQHTDSHSTGMVEVTSTPKGESAVKDVRDWESKRPQFLKDVAEQKLHFYFNPLHKTTSRAEKGMNPPILSAIRYLTKAFQYDLEISGEDRKRIQAIVNDFKAKDASNDYVAKWIEKNGKKLFQHAVDIEYAWDTLEDLGLRKKLIGLRNDSGISDSLAWWMNKSPLRTKPVGKGGGKTAAQIFGKNLTFSHETNSFLAYESITRSKVGELNGLISRKGFLDEAAAYGDGFYALQGRQGARGTGITIRMNLDPKARLGTDFISNANVIVIKNKAAVHVISEQIQITLPEYFQMLQAGQEFSDDDRALFEAFKRKISRQALISPEEKSEIAAEIKANIEKGSLKQNVAAEWFSLPMSQEFPELVEILEKSKSLSADQMLASFVYSQAPWAARVNELRALVDRDTASDLVIKAVFSKAFWKNESETFRRALAKENTEELVSKHLLSSLSQDHWVGRTEIVQDLLDRHNSKVTEEVASIFYRPGWAEYPETLKKIIQQADTSGSQKIVYAMSLDPVWQRYPEFLMELIKNKATVEKEVFALLKKGNWRNQPQLVELMMKHWPHRSKEYAAILALPGWDMDPVLVRKLAENRNNHQDILIHLLSKPGWEKYPDIAQGILDQGIEVDLANKRFISSLLSEPQWVGHPEWVEHFLGSGKYDRDIAQFVLSQPQWADHPEWVETILNRGKVNFEIIAYVLSQPQWQGHPEWIEKLIAGGEKGFTNAHIIQFLLSKPQWRHRSDWLEHFLAHGKEVEDQALATYVLRHHSDHPEWAKTIVKRGHADEEIVRDTLSHEGWEKHPEILESIIRKDKQVYGVANLFAKPQWKNPELLKVFVDMPSQFRKVNDITIAAEVLSNAQWADHPEFVEALIRRNLAYTEVNKMLKLPHWQNNAALQSAVGKKPITYRSLQKAFNEGFTFVGATVPEAAVAPLKVPENCAGKFAEVSR